MRVMEMVSVRSLNGAVMHAFLVARELHKQGHEVTVLCRPNSWIAEQSLVMGCRVEYSDMHRIPTDELRRVAGVIRDRGIEVLHTHTSRANFFGVLLRWFAGVPCVATTNHAHFQLHYMFNDAVIAVSEATLRYQRRMNLVRRSRSSLIPNFIDETKFERQPRDRAEIRRSLGVPESTFLIGVIGNIIERKGQHVIVEALAHVRKEHNVSLALVGKPSRGYTELVRARVEELGLQDAVYWLGQRSDIPDILGALDVMALPTFKEALPLSILEGMMCGLPVIASAVDGIPEMVIDGETGCLTQPGDVKSLANAISSLAGDQQRCKSYGATGHRRFYEHFSVESVMPRIERVLESTISSRTLKLAA